MWVREDFRNNVETRFTPSPTRRSEFPSQNKTQWFIQSSLYCVFEYGTFNRYLKVSRRFLLGPYPISFIVSGRPDVESRTVTSGPRTVPQNVPLFLPYSFTPCRFAQHALGSSQPPLTRTNVPKDPCGVPRRRSFLPWEVVGTECRGPVRAL